MSQLHCYWEEADRWLNRGEIKIKTHCPWVNCCWGLVATVQHSCWSTNPFPVAFQITLYLGKCCLLTGQHMSCFTSPGLSDTVYSTFVAPCQWCAKMVTDYSVETILKNCVFNWYFKKTMKSVDSIKIKNMPLANLIYKVSCTILSNFVNLL